MLYIVTAETITTHSARVRAADEDEAASLYLDGEWVEDLGDELLAPEAYVLSVERDNDQTDPA